jgi:hypothetical protein
LKITQKLERILGEFRKSLELVAASRTIPSRLELRANNFRVISGNQNLVSNSEIKTVQVDIELGSRTVTLPQNCVLEERVFRGETRETAYPDVKELARTLAVLGESNGILQFAGFQILPQTFPADLHVRFVFLFPQNHNYPLSLRDLLLAPQGSDIAPVPRNYRFLLPTKLAQAILSVHSRNLVHKDIRPETVVVFDAVEASHFPKRIGDLYLTGWHLIRKATAASSRQSGVNEWAVSMYQHPSRQRQVPEGRLNFKYTVGHDIYSLGVCMLELGLWKSLVSYDATGVASESPLLLEHERCWKEQHSAEVRTKT